MRIVRAFGTLAVALVLSGRADAAIVYETGPILGTLGGRNISGYQFDNQYQVSNSFSVTQNVELTSATIGLWMYLGYGVSEAATPHQLNWSIGTSAFGADMAGGTSSIFSELLTSYPSEFNVFRSSFEIGGTLSAETTYWLTLSDARVDASAGKSLLFWDNATLEQTGLQLLGGGIQPVEGAAFLLEGNVVAVPEPSAVVMLATACIALFGTRRKCVRA